MEENHYYPFGLTISSAAAGGVPNKYKFGGKELEQSFGLELYDFHARQYDPQLGRFTSVDPLADYAPGWNPYRFGFNNPVLYTDPTGLFETESAASDYATKNNLTNYTIKHQVIDDKDVYTVETENDFFEMVNGEVLFGATVSAKINASPTEEELQQNGGGNGYKLADGFGQLINAGGAVWGAAAMGGNYLRQNNGAEVIGRFLGFGTEQTARSLSGTVKTLGAWGKNLGTAGMVLSSINYVAQGLDPSQTISTATHVNFWLSAGFYGAAAIIGGPIIGGAALIYGAGQLGSYMFTGNTLEENYFGK